MATVYGNQVTRSNGGKFKAYATYTKSSESDTSVTYTITMGMYCVSAYTSYNANATLGSYSASSSKIGGSKGTSHAMISSKTYTYSKTKSAQTKTISFSLWSVSTSSKSSGTISLSIPAKTSYTVKYNANGGTGSIANQTKWYGETLQLSNGSGISRTNYSLLGWNTSSSATSPNHSLSENYTSNAALNLYAVWKLDYIKPVFGDVIVQRTDANNTTENDEGTAIYVNVPYTEGSIGDTTYDPTIVVTIDGTTVYTGTITGGSYSNWFTDYDINNAHSVTIQLYDSQDSTGVSITRSVASAVFPIDILADGSAMGIMHVAVEGQTLTLAGGTHVDGDLFADNIITDAEMNGNYNFIALKTTVTLTTTWTNVLSMELTKGLWLVGAKLRNTTAHTAARSVYFHVTNDADSTWVEQGYYVPSGVYSGNGLFKPYRLEADATVYLAARVASGTITLDANTTLFAVKIANIQEV